MRRLLQAARMKALRWPPAGLDILNPTKHKTQKVNFKYKMKLQQLIWMVVECAHNLWSQFCIMQTMVDEEAASSKYHTNPTYMYRATYVNY